MHHGETVSNSEYRPVFSVHTKSSLAYVLLSCRDFKFSCGGGCTKKEALLLSEFKTGNVKHTSNNIE